MEALSLEIFLHIIAHCQLAEPAGVLRFRPFPVLDLGWFRLCHVCACWRRIIIGSPLLWAERVCTFYSLPFVEAFLLRALDAPLVLDFNTLHHHSVGIPRNQTILDRLLQPSVLLRAGAIYSNSCKHPGFRGFTAAWPALLSSGLFAKLACVDIFLMPSTIAMDQFANLPSLERLALRSCARRRTEAPVSPTCIIGISSNCRHLRTLELVRVLTENPVPREYIPDCRQADRSLKSLRIVDFDERPSVWMLPALGLASDAIVELEFIRVSSIQIAHYDVLQRLRLDTHSQHHLVVDQLVSETFYGKSVIPIYHSTYALVNVTYEGSLSAQIRYRLDWESPSWTWGEFSHLFSSHTLQELTLSSFDLDYGGHPPEHTLPLVEGLHGLRTLRLGDKSHMRLLFSLPKCAPLGSIHLAFGPSTRELISLLDWMRLRNTSPTLAVHLAGEVTTEVYYDEESEVPILPALRERCELYDRRED